MVTVGRLFVASCSIYNIKIEKSLTQEQMYDIIYKENAKRVSFFRVAITDFADNRVVGHVLSRFCIVERLDSWLLRLNKT